MKRSLAMLAIFVAIVLCALAWRWNRVAFLGAYLAAWWFWVGIVMGGLANVWLHNLTGGKWGEAIRTPLLRIAASTWIVALLFLPVLIGMVDLYPWVADAGRGAARWSDAVAAPDFKSRWLTPGFFIGRSIAYLSIWTVLAQLTLRPALQRSRGFSAAALILYGFSVSGAAIDWIMSLTPLWYSSVFGWLMGVGQMLSGMAAAIWLISAANKRERSVLSRDLGNLLLMYVMTWAYLSFVQFLIIWAENLPHEIAWYLARAQGGWLAMAWVLGVFLFAMPLLILLFRRAKDTPLVLRRLAAVILFMKLIDSWWQILPSLPAPAIGWWLTAPLCAAAVGIVLFATARHAPLRSIWEESAHV
jgi:hypothetical protein